jgi:hypothetical protein
MPGVEAFLNQHRDREMPHEDLRSSVASAVLSVLATDGFFQRLDDRLCPADTSQKPDLCKGTYEIAIALLHEIGIKEERIPDVTEVFAAYGAHCDCEVLYKVATRSRLTSKYWKDRGLNPQSNESQRPAHQS